MYGTLIQSSGPQKNPNSWFRFRLFSHTSSSFSILSQTKLVLFFRCFWDFQFGSMRKTSDSKIAVGLIVFQQLGGINGVCFYVSNIFEQAGFSSSVGTITYAILQVVVTAVAASVMDKAGRKPLILVSASGLVLGSLLTTISFFLKVLELALTATPILAVTGILIYI